MRNLIPIGDGYLHPILKEYLKQALGCPDCGSTSLEYNGEERVIPRFAVVCQECGYPGPLARDLQGAVKKWNKPLGFFARLRMRRLRKRRMEEWAKRLQQHRLLQSRKEARA